MKNIGIIGGFGPETSALFQLRLNDICLERRARNRPGIMTWNTPVSLRLERDLILSGRGIEQFLPLLVKAVQVLEQSNADFIVLPCNTLHIHIKRLKQISSIPILNIIEESVNFLHHQGVQKVAILGTRIAINSQMHLRQLQQAGIEGIIPNPADQKAIDHVIHNVLIGQNLDSSKSRLKVIMQKLGKNCDNNFLLACTDLQILLSSSNRFQIFDSMEILAQASVNKLLED